MSSNTYATPLHIDILPSRALAVLLVLTHGGAAVWLFFLPISWWIVVILAVGIFASGYAYMYKYVWRRSSQAIMRLIWRDGDEWLCLLRDGSQRLAKLKPGAFVHPWLVVLPLQPEKGRRLHCALFYDAAAADVLRRLRIRLSAFREFEN